MRFAIVALALAVTGVLAVACNAESGPSQEEIDDYMHELEGDYRECYREFVTRYYDDGGPNSQYADTMTGQFIAADDPTTLEMLRDQCYGALRCPPSQSVYYGGKCTPGQP